jgi:hypothetical protein
MEALHRHPWFSNLNCPWEEIGLKKLKPAFVPDKDKVCCVGVLHNGYLGSAAAAPLLVRGQ